MIKVSLIDFHTAEQKYNKAMIEFAILNCDHDLEPYSIFKLQSLWKCNAYLNQQPLLYLLTDLQTDITAADYIQIKASDGPTCKSQTKCISQICRVHHNKSVGFTTKTNHTGASRTPVNSTLQNRGASHIAINETPQNQAIDTPNV